jgi:polyribonucleotide nucleotidyltransferase
MKHEVAVELTGGKRLVFETGRIAKQASGAAFVTLGESVVLATAVASPDPKEGIDFFPLTVDYREYTYAGGRIPGGFIKREGRPSEKEILTCRQIDRPIRPLFPDGFRNETQVIALVMSADKENDPDVVGINAAGCALALSDIPFGATVGAVRVGRVDGEFVVNPTYSERNQHHEHHRRRPQRRHHDDRERREGRVGRESSSRPSSSPTKRSRRLPLPSMSWLRWPASRSGLYCSSDDEAYYNELFAKVGDKLKDALDTKSIQRPTATP